MRCRISNRWNFFFAIFQSLELFAFAADPSFTPRDRAHLDRALAELNMTEHDLSATKDIGEPRVALQWIRDALHDPLQLPARADAIIADAETDLWRLADAMLEIPAATNEPAEPEPVTGDMWEGLDPELASTMTLFVNSARRADALLTRAFAQLSPEDKSYLAAAELCGVLHAEDNDEARKEIAAEGVSTQAIAQAIADALALDPEPAATRYLELAAKVDRRALFDAGRIFGEGVRALFTDAQKITNWPSGHITVATDLGRIRITPGGDEQYSDDCLLILSTGGHNVYGGHAGVANGLGKQRMAAIVDLAGDDEYDSARLLGAGSALFGLSAIMDAGGDDIYRAKYLGQASALWGVACLEDFSGNDSYRARLLSQSAAVMGLSLLRDHTGNDDYSVGLFGQAFAGPFAFSLLEDDAGHDRYFAGGVDHDFERNDARFTSLSQGFATGLRPYAGGGVAALLDREGNDTYIADVFGQGVSYWYSAGFLLDLAGHDSYQLYQYGQGCGIHLSLGLLLDGDGNDKYSAFSLAQGAAHDFAVGLLLERGGNDTFTAGEHAQGHGMNQSLALLLDESGDDAYFARDTTVSQGIGNDGMPRDYGSLGLLLDLGGRDTYSCGAVNNHTLLRPLYGAIYDREEAK